MDPLTHTLIGASLASSKLGEKTRFATAALVIGANDVINPIARYDTTSPIYGMPILDVDKAKHIIIIKRSLNPGFAGIDNELFYDRKALMFFGSAREKVQELVSEVKKL